MENKYSLEIQNQINEILNYLNTWKELFFVRVEYYEEGWAISLREKNIYQRYIVIFKPYKHSLYCIKSFEIHYNHNKNETFKEIYHNEKIYNLNELAAEIKEIVYGKDITDNLMRNFYKNTP